jgi:SH3-like domain-containing protein
VNPTSIQGLRARTALVAVLSALVLVAGCNRAALTPKEYVWVTVPQANLRDRVAALYNKVASVKNGDRLEVLDRQKRFVKVRTDAGQEGWIEQRYIVTADVYDGFQKLATDNSKLAAQGHGITRNSLNMHLTPARDSEHLYQLAEGDHVELLRRGTGEKPGAINGPRPSEPANESKSGTKLEPTVEKTAPPTPAPVLEDWWLVRDAQKHVGWVLSRMIDIDVPIDVAQYAEGQRIVGAFVLNAINDPGYVPPPDDNAGSGDTAAATPAPAKSADPHIRPQYLVVLTEPKDGMPFDYNQARVFTWNTKRHRYETAYRERNLFGMLPVSVGSENFDKEGTLPTFTLHVQDENGKVVERKYKLNGPIVRRALAPGEAQTKMAALPKSEKRKTKPAHKGRRR